MFDDMQFIRKINLKNRQRQLNKRYEKEGLTDELLKKQIQLNKERFEEDIPDSSEILYDEFVQ